MRQVLTATNVNRPKGQLTADDRTWEIRTNDQLHKAEEYLPLIVAYRNGRAVQLSDVATVEKSVEDLSDHGSGERHAGGAGDYLPAGRAPTSSRQWTGFARDCRSWKRRFRAAWPSIVVDRTPVIRASLHDVERTLIISVGLVILVVFVFLRDVSRHAYP